MTMSVYVRIEYGDKQHTQHTTVENHFPGVKEDITTFVRETLTGVIADIERLEGQ